MRPQFANIPGAIAFPINPPSLGQPFRSTPVEYIIMSQIPYPDLQRLVDRFVDEARKYPGVQNLQIDLRLNTPEVRVRSAELHDDAANFGRTVGKFGAAVEALLRKHQEAILEKQYLLGRVADVATELYVGGSVLNRLDVEVPKAAAPALIRFGASIGSCGP